MRYLTKLTQQKLRATILCYSVPATFNGAAVTNGISHFISNYIMKHIFFLFSVLFTIIFISSCNLNTTSHEYRDVCDNTIVIGVTRQDLIDFKPGLLFDKFDLIPLEESAESLVGVIKKMVVKDSAIFILDDT